MEQRVDTIHLREPFPRQVTELPRQYKLAEELAQRENKPPRKRVESAVSVRLDYRAQQLCVLRCAVPRAWLGYCRVHPGMLG